MNSSRPVPVRWFERLLLPALAIDLVNNLIAWNSHAAGARALPASPVVTLILGIVPPALGLVFWYLIAVKRSNGARVVMTILVVLGGVGFVAAASRGSAAIWQPMFVVAALTETLKLAAVACLFAGSAAAWFDRRPLAH